MPKRDAPKVTKGTRNDSRKNGKAFKQNPGSRKRLTPKQTPVQLVLLNQGLYVNVTKRLMENA